MTTTRRAILIYLVSGLACSYQKGTPSENATLSGRILIVGGDSAADRVLSSGVNYSASVEIFDTRRKAFSDGIDLPSGRGFLGAARVGNFVYAIGGLVENFVESGWRNWSYLSTNERLDVGGQSQKVAWNTRNPMPTPRCQLAVVASSSTVFALGGRYDFSYLNTSEAFDSVTQSWTSLRDMPTERYGLAAGIIGDFLYAVGGFSWLGSLNVVEKYSISSDKWSTAAPMKTARGFHATAVLNGKLFVIGGRNNSAVFSSVEVYTPSTNKWSRAADLSVAREGFGAAAVDGLIYVFGGKSSTNVFGAYLDSVEVYNPTSDSWQTLAAKMKVARAYLAVAVIDALGEKDKGSRVSHSSNATTRRPANG